MNGRAQLARNREFFLNASTGALSGLLYLSYVLSFAFLVPVQHVFAGRGRRSGLVAAAFALVVIAAGQAGRMIELQALNVLTLSVGILPPLLLLAAVGFINMKAGRLGSGNKIFIAAAVLSVVAAPFILEATSDRNFSSWLIEYVGEAMKSSGFAGDGTAYAREAVESAILVLRSAFAVFILWILAASWWLGSWFAARAALREKKSDGGMPASIHLAAIRVPYIALWPTLLSWALLFAALLTKQKGLFSAITWNIALCAASLYAMQGIGILSHLITQFNASRLVRILAPLALMVMVLSPTAGAIMLIALPLLGITEVWLPYRTIKGALK